MNFMLKQLDRNGDKFKVLSQDLEVGQILFNDSDYPGFEAGWYYSPDYKERLSSKEAAAVALLNQLSKK